ncbi:MAG: acyltransferase family protein, partial [Pseudomonadota bacterium]
LPDNQPWHVNMPNVAAFWIKRFWRLVPSAWLWLVLILLAAIFFNTSGAFGSVLANYEATIAGILQVANFRFADVFGRTEYGASFVYWSLSLEEQFYLIFPFLILLSKKRLPWVLALIAAVQLLQSRDLLGMALRTDGLALGALIALWQGHRSYQLFEPLFLRKAIVRRVLFVVLLMFIGSIGASGIRVVPNGFSLIAVLAAVLVFFASFDRGYIDVPGPVRGFLVWLGSRSYTLYLIHVPAFFATREIFFLYSPGRVLEGKENWVPVVAVFIVLAVILVEVNYRFIEKPCRSYGAKIARRYEQQVQGPAV